MIQTPEDFVRAIDAIRPLYFSTLGKVKEVKDATLVVELHSGEEIYGVTHNHEGKPAVGSTCLITYRNNMPNRPHASDFSLYDTIDVELTSGANIKADEEEVSIEYSMMRFRMKDGEIVVEAADITLEGDISIDGNVNISGNVEADGEVTAKASSTISNLSTHMHATAAPGSPSPPTPGT